MNKDELSNPMEEKSRYQIVISGVGGQGVLFITRLLAEAAIEKNLPVFTSETHGMAQRGGTVISHLKVGEFSSPLINPGRAGGLIALKAENMAQHGGYLKADAWAAVNSPAAMELPASSRVFETDADRLARELGDPRSLNLIMLGFTLACAPQGGADRAMLHCSLDDIKTVLENRLKGKVDLLQSSLRALMAGAENAAA
jgi:indolepyruvate ferredoxin oxidoreductase beta subunit